ncbi:acyltransferase family protein [Paractinoplanes globisporus]|uniref:Acyltransferase family protein n=1 Tax=Paractinoplanes globisporus TaxID=113565 RepID=A0ABW6WAL2_9ACTN|nr:acyltransferase [Actinoplanes globisporus]
MTAVASALSPSPVAAERSSRGPIRPRRVAFLDGLRLLAALSVLGYHYLALPDGWDEQSRAVFPHLYLPASYGWLGVQLFFLISGFVICMSAWDRGLGSFFVSRVSRLYPAYWTAVLISATVLTLWPLTHKAPSHGDVLTNLTMLNEPLGVSHVDGVYWTLWVELRFYLLFALVVWRGLTYRRVVLFCAIWTAASVIAEGAGSDVLRTVVDPQYSAYFVAGIACYLMYRFGQSALLWGIFGISFLLAEHQIWVTFENIEKRIDHDLPNWPVLAILAACFAVVAAVAVGVFDRVQARWLTVAGVLTYPLYLLHAEIGWVVIRALHDRVPPALLVTGLAAGMLFAAWLLHRVVERPLAPRIRRVLRTELERVR